MINVGITGQSGFVGTHLFNFLNQKDDIETIAFEDYFFQDRARLNLFAKSCDAIVHLAALNRHADQQKIYDVNIKLVQQLIEACEDTRSRPHILFASSTQEELENLYGNSKRDGRLLLEKWAHRSNAHFSGLIIPNIFGPFGHPQYNSFIATFSHLLTHGGIPKIHIDKTVNLIYINELLKIIYSIIQNKSPLGKIEIQPTSSKRVTSILDLLVNYRDNYFKSGIIPDLSNEFERNLFNTFVCYIDHETFFPFHLTKHVDDRGSFTEIARFLSGGQISFSISRPRIVRGNHYHTRKAERFIVIKGKARIDLRRIGTNKTLSFIIDGEKPSFVDIPIWHTHSVTNIGSDELYIVFWISEHYDPEDEDTYNAEI